MIAVINLQALAGWAALLGGMVLSFLYSGLETGIYTVSKIRLDLRAESGHRPARRLRAISSDPNRPLIVLLIGNNLANYLASAGMVLLLTSGGLAHTDWYAAAILTPLVFIFCELLPKSLFHRHGETLTYLLWWFLDLSRAVFSAVGVVGLVRLLVWVVMKLAGRRLDSGGGPLGGEGRFAAILAEGQASGAITRTQSAIAERVVNIRHVRLSEVMIPLNAAVLVEASASIEQVRDLLRDHGHPRMGVYEAARDNIVGTLDAYDVLLDAAGEPPAEHVAAALKLPADLPVINALVIMQQNRRYIAFVVGDGGRCVGLVTVKDLVEEIVGELEEW